MASVAAGVKRTFTTMSAGQSDWNGQRPLSRPHEAPVSRASSRGFFPGDTSSEAEISRSNSSSPPLGYVDAKRITSFEPEASIVLIGIRGAGKSTLAIIASTAMKRRIIDTEKSFLEATQLSTSAYKKRHGAADYHRQQFQLLQSLLRTHSKDCIIVCPWMERNVHALFEDFAATHPVIHILREVQAVQEHLKVSNEVKLRDLLNYSSATFRSCANFEFFNISENVSRASTPTAQAGPGIDISMGQKTPAPYLALKRAERHFLKFLSLIMPKETIPFIESAFPLASIPTETRRFTYAASVPFSRLVNGDLDVADLETGADAIEVVIDDIGCSASDSTSGAADRLSPDRANTISRIIGNIRRSTVIPIIYDVRWPERAATDLGQKTLYLEYIRHGLRLSPEYITLDLRLDETSFSQVVACKRTSKIIGNLHLSVHPLPRWVDPVWMSYYRWAERLKCDLVRMTKPAVDIEDNFDINRLRRDIEKLGQHGLPLIAFNTGSKGRHSAVFNQVMTSVIPEPLVNQQLENGGSSSTYITPSVTALQATRTLFSSFIYDAMKLYVFGAEVDYSLSPAMHNTALRACGIPHFYRPHSTSSLNSIRDIVHDHEFAGASIGLPFKVEVISLTHSLSRHAKAIGAVNTLIPIRHLNPDGNVPEDALLFNCHSRAGPVVALYGENTDWVGIRACIRRGLSPANAVRPSTVGLVIGAGGMARATVYAMLQLGVKNIMIYNRTVANAEKLVAHFTRLLSRNDLPLLSSTSNGDTRFHIIRSLDQAWPTQFRHPTMIVSCIPTHSIGKTPSPDFTAPEKWLSSPTGGVVVELAYKTLNTPLLEQIRAEAHRGWVVMDGLDLLPEQGFAQFELFTGRRAPRRLQRMEVFRAYPEHEQGRSNRPQLQPRLENIVEQEP